MKEFIVIMLLIAFATTCCKAQSGSYFNGVVGYVELGGHAGDYSVNIEHKFFNTRHLTFNGWIGFGKGTFGSGESKRNFLGVPVGVSVFTGSKSSHLQIDVAVSYLEGREYNFFGQDSKSLYIVPGFGYRFQKPNGGLFLKAQYTPLIKVKEYTDILPFQRTGAQHFFGVSAGYFFARNKKS